MKVIPYGGFVLVKIEDAPKTTESGLILLPETATNKPCRGEVLAVGPGRVEEDDIFRKIDLKEGDRVLWDRMGSHEVPDMPELRLVSAPYVLGTLSEASA